MNKQYTIINILIFFLIILFNTAYSNAEISQKEVKSDIESLIYAGDYFVMQSEQTKQVIQKMRNNPAPYISYVREHLYLPEDKETLSVSEDTLKYYCGLVGILFEIGNQEAKDIILEESSKQESLLEILNNEMNMTRETLSDNEFNLIFKSLQNITFVYINTINKFTNYRDNSIVSNCLNQFDKRNPIFGYNALLYFEEVASENPMVITRLVAIYKNPESEWFQHNSLEASIERIWGDLNYSEMINELILYIENAYQEGLIDNKGTANSLKKKLEHARAQLDKGKIKQAVNQLNAFLNELEAQKDKHVNEEAYNLLHFNAEALIERMEE